MKSTILFFLFLVSSSVALSQGCSDAGFCTAGALNGYGLDKTEDQKRNEVKLTLGYEVGEQRINLFIPTLEGSFALDEYNVVQLKIPYQVASGDLGTNSGIGDFIASFSHQFYNKKKFKFSGTVGARIASGNANDAIDGAQAPMPYQTSLGTYDAILGMRFQYGTWILATGAQIPLSQNNNNEYNPLDFPNESAFFLSNNLERKADIMLRAEKVFPFKKGYLKAGVLPIYHLAEDTFLEEQPNGEFARIDAEGSQGLTVNITGAARYEIKDHWVVELAGGAPIIVRDNRPDGLTRYFVLRPSLAYRF